MTDCIPDRGNGGQERRGAGSESDGEMNGEALRYCTSRNDW